MYQANVLHTIQNIDTTTVDTETAWTVPFAPEADTVDEETTFGEPHFVACYDSVFARYDTMSAETRESLFAGNEHCSVRVEPVPHNSQHTPEWIFLFLFVLIAILSVYVNARKVKIVQIVQSIFDRRTLDRVFRENNLSPSAFFATSAIYIGALSLIFFEALQSYNVLPSLPTMAQFAVVLLVLSLFVLIKGGMIRLIGIIFEDRNATNLYVANNNVIYFVGNLIILPLALLSFYSPVQHDAFSIATYIAIAIVFIIRVVRGQFLILTNSKTSKLYLFCYLCIFEVIPPLLAIKMVIM